VLESHQREIAYQARTMRCKMIENLDTPSGLSNHRCTSGPAFLTLFGQFQFLDSSWHLIEGFFMLALAHLATDQNVCDRLVLV
jgi:hypothetical protein